MVPLRAIGGGRRRLCATRRYRSRSSRPRAAGYGGGPARRAPRAPPRD